MVFFYHSPVPVSHTVCHAVDGEYPVGHRRQGADGDQGIHIRGAVPKGLEAPLKVLPVDIDNRKAEQELCKAVQNSVFHPRQDSWDGKPHHMSH